MKKSEVIKLGHWPQWFTENIVSPIPDVRIPSNTRLVWNCPLHGNYEKLVSSKLLLPDCPECLSILKSKRRMERTNYLENLSEESLRVIKTSPQYKQICESRIKAKESIDVVCPIHGMYKTTIQYVRKTGFMTCPKCAYDRRKLTIKKTLREKNPWTEWQLSEINNSPDKERILSGLDVHEKVKWLCTDCLNYFEQRIYSHLFDGDMCPECGKRNVWASSIERKLFNDLREVNPRLTERAVITSPLTKRPLELDLFIECKSLAIEVNGLYYHSYEYMQESLRYNAPGGKQNYHLMKTEACEAKGIQLIHLFEDDLRDKYEICLNLIKSKLGLLFRAKVGARQCEVREVSTEDAKSFYNENHIQGYGQGICFGLYYNDRLLSALSVRRCDTNEKDVGSHELNRYASVSDVFVVGGLQKLMKYAELKLCIHRWVSYADRCISNGSMYFNDGWTLVETSKPDYKYVYNGRRVHKFNFRIKRFKNDSNLEYREGLSERELAELNGLSRIYDCGKLKFVKEVGPKLI